MKSDTLHNGTYQKLFITRWFGWLVLRFQAIGSHFRARPRVTLPHASVSAYSPKADLKQNSNLLMCPWCKPSHKLTPDQYFESLEVLRCVRVRRVEHPENGVIEVKY